MIKCKYCYREIPSNFETEKGCQWCDAEWRHNELNHISWLKKYYNKEGKYGR